MRRRVVVDADGLLRRAGDIAGEVRRAVPQAVVAVAEPGRVDRRVPRGGRRAGLHPGAAPFALDHRLRAGILGEGHPGAVEQGFAEAHAAASVVARERDPLGAAAPAAGGQIAADPGRRPTVVLDGDRQRPQRRPRFRFEAAPLAFGPRAEQAILQRRLRRGKAGDEVARGDVGGGGSREGVEVAVPGANPNPLLDPVVQRVPPGAADAGDAGAGRRPQRQRAKRVPETVEPPRVKLFKWAPSKGSAPGGVAHQESGRNLAPPVVSAQSASASRCQPHWATAYLPAVASRAASSSKARARAIPIATIRPSPPRVPDIRPPLLACTWRDKGTAARSLPPADGCPAGAVTVPGASLCENDRDAPAERGTDHREAARRHRPRAAPLDRRAGHGPLDRGLRRRPGRGGRLADHGRLPDPRPLRTGGRPAGLRAGRRHRRRGRLRRPLRRGERRPAEDARPRQAAGGRPGPGQERDLRRLRQGRRRQVDDDRQPGCGAERRRARRRRPRLRRLRLLDPAHARRQPQTGSQRGAQDPAAGGGGRGQGDVDRLLRRGELRGRLARPDAPQGDPAVPRGRRLGRAGVPAARPAAGDRRRLDDALPAPAAGQVRDSHHAAAGGPDGRQTRPPTWRSSSTSSCSA